MRSINDIAKDFIEEISEGEWSNDLVRKDTSRLAEILRKDRENMRMKCAEIAERWTTPEQREHGAGGPAAEILRVGVN